MRSHSSRALTWSMSGSLCQNARLLMPCWGCWTTAICVWKVRKYFLSQRWQFSSWVLCSLLCLYGRAQAEPPDKPYGVCAGACGMTAAAFLQHRRKSSMAASCKHPVLIMCAGNVSEASFDKAKELVAR